MEERRTGARDGSFTDEAVLREKRGGGPGPMAPGGEGGGHVEVVAVVGGRCRQLMGAAEVGGGRTTRWRANMGWSKGAVWEKTHGPVQ
jgi:hypothetical protein